MPHYALPHEIMYHTGLSREMTEGARYALVPGDPGRVEGLAKALDEKASLSALTGISPPGRPGFPAKRCWSCPLAWAVPVSPLR